MRLLVIGKKQILKKGQFFIKYSLLKTIWYSFFSAVEAHRLFSILVSRRTKINKYSSAKIIIRGRLYLGMNHQGFPRYKPSVLNMAKSSRLIINGNVRLFVGHEIDILEGACLKIGTGYINTNAKIVCSHSIEIGSDTVISDRVIIMDSDFHQISDDQIEKAPISIGEHVWIGSRAMILKGVRIGDGAVVGAGSVVTKNVPTNALVAGVPARVIRSNIEWK